MDRREKLLVFCVSWTLVSAILMALNLATGEGAFLTVIKSAFIGCCIGTTLRWMMEQP